MNGNSRAAKGLKSLEQVTENKSMSALSPCVGVDGAVKGNSQKRQKGTGRVLSGQVTLHLNLCCHLHRQLFSLQPAQLFKTKGVASGQIQHWAVWKC